MIIKKSGSIDKYCTPSSCKYIYIIKNSIDPNSIIEFSPGSDTGFLSEYTSRKSGSYEDKYNSLVTPYKDEYDIFDLK